VLIPYKNVAWLRRAHNVGIAVRVHQARYENDLTPENATVELSSPGGWPAIAPCLKLPTNMESVGGRSSGGLHRCGNVFKSQPLLVRLPVRSTFSTGYICQEERMLRSFAKRWRHRFPGCLLTEKPWRTGRPFWRDCRCLTQRWLMARKACCPPFDACGRKRRFSGAWFILNDSPESGWHDNPKPARAKNYWYSYSDYSACARRNNADVGCVSTGAGNVGTLPFLRCAATVNRRPGKSVLGGTRIETFVPHAHSSAMRCRIFLPTLITRMCHEQRTMLKGAWTAGSRS